MAWQLVGEVLDLAVPMTQSEKLVLICLAWLSYANTRDCIATEADLCRRTGLKPRGLSAALARLADRGIETRIPLEVGASGRGAYSRPGTRRAYRLPEFPAEWSHQSATVCTERSHSGATEQQNGRTLVSKRSHSGATIPRGHSFISNTDKSKDNYYYSAQDYFAQFWFEYPDGVHKRNRYRAQIAWDAELSDGADPEEIIEAARQYAAQIRITGTDPQFISYPDNFLSKHRWRDYPRVRQVPLDSAP